MTTRFSMTRDINGYNGFGLPFSDTKIAGKLTASAEQNVEVPKNPIPNASAAPYDYIAIFSFEPGDTVWVALNATAAIPSGAIAVTTSELNPVARVVKEGDILSFISSNENVEFGVTFYAL